MMMGPLSIILARFAPPSKLFFFYQVGLVTLNIYFAKSLLFIHTNAVNRVEEFGKCLIEEELNNRNWCNNTLIVMYLVGPCYVNFLVFLGGTFYCVLISYVLSLCGIEGKIILFDFSRTAVPTFEQKRTFYVERSRARGLNKLPTRWKKSCSICLKKLKVPEEQISILLCKKKLSNCNNLTLLQRHLFHSDCLK